MIEESVYNKVIIYVVIGLAFLVVALRVSFFYTPVCGGFECFQDSMRVCSKAIYINEDIEATWRYEIMGVRNEQCEVKTMLVQPKAGELKLEKLAGLDMVCGFPIGITTYPEKFLDNCHGRLKEELQGIVIEKLHTYIIEKIGEIDESLDLLSGF